MSPSRPALPQYDLDPGTRYRRLERVRERYRYAVVRNMRLAQVGEHHRSAIVPETRIVVLEHLVRRERFDLAYDFSRAWSGAKFFLNLALVEARIRWKRKPGLEDYRRFYPVMRDPWVQRRYGGDAIFGAQYLAGPDPFELRLLSESPRDFPVTDALLSQALRKRTTVQAELAERRLFYADYSWFHEVVEATDGRTDGRFFAAPRVLLHHAPAVAAGEGLRPVAIQLRPTPAKDNPIYTPADGVDWEAAKVFAQVGACTSHELKRHLAEAHLVLEPLIIFAHRNLAANHPLMRLLAPHFEDTLAVNDFGRDTLINPGGFLDQLMAGTLEETMSIVARGVDDFHWNQMEFHRDLKRRGVNEPKTVPFYPYRDDGSLVVKAIRKFVDAYVRLYYREDREVAEDLEVARWLTDLGGPGRMRGTPAKLETVSELVDFTTQLVWWCGPHHACVNYPQWDYVAFVPNRPFSVRSRAPRSKGHYLSHEDVDALYPDYRMSLKQIMLMDALTGWQHTRLGRYDRGAFRGDARVKPLVKAFQVRLREIDQIIDERNVARAVPYPYLKPARIPNSTNV